MASSWFWRVMIVLFVLQAVYLALVGRYAMAFDEQFHFAAIQEYARVLLPWQITQPPGPAELSAFTADGSYLYHYLASWPYRLTAFITDSQTAQIIVLRLMDVGIVTVGLYVYRRLLLLLGLPRAAAHVILALVMLMPMTPWLAGQLTYDAPFMTLCGVTMLALFKLVRAISVRRTIPLVPAAWSVSLLLITAQVKYAFLPVVLGASVYVLALIVLQLKRRRISWPAVQQSWRQTMSLGSGTLAVGVLLLSGVFFMQRYGMNVVQYGTPVPSCNTVLGHERCLGFGPYGRDARIHSEGWYETISTQNKLGYPKIWFDKMVYESYFAVGPLETGYSTKKPLPVPYTIGKALALFGVLVLVFRFVWLIRRGPQAQLALVIVAAYVLALFAVNFKAYLYTAIPVTIHGRYVLPFLPLAGYLVYMAVRPLLRTRRLKQAATVLAALAVLGSAWGGGIGAWTIGANDDWHWPNARPATHVVRDITEKIVLQ